MVAWIGVHADMSLGFFWVQESHRRKGTLSPGPGAQVVYNTPPPPDTVPEVVEC
jgi:hypothetical protein